MIEEGGMMRSSRDLENDQQLFSKVCVWVLLSCFSRTSTLIFGNSEELQQSIEFTRSFTQRMGVILCNDS